MKHLVYCIVAITFLLPNCSRKTETNTKREPSSVAVETNYERFTSDRLMLTLAGDDKQKSKLISLRFSYVGKEGSKEAFEENQELISNLIRTTIIDYSLEEIQKDDGQQRLEKSVLEAINSYIADSQFLTIEVSELREI